MRTFKNILLFLTIPVFLLAQYTGGNGDGFSVWTSQEDISLPVELLSYHTLVSEQNILIEWVTASELENLGFIVKRKEKGESEYKTLDGYRWNAGLRGMGTSSFGQRYSFRDFGVLAGHEYRYQIVSVDYAGRQQIIIQTTALKYSGENSVIPSGFAVQQNYPNPFNPSTTISFKIDKTRHVKLTVYAINGALVQVLADRDFAAGKYDIKFSADPSLSSNFYICRFQSGPLVKFLKMTYLK